MKRILCVEDDSQTIVLLKYILSSHGYDVLFAVNGEEALDFAIREMPDLILMVLFLPGMDGPEVAEILKATPETAHIPVIAVTAWPSQQVSDNFHTDFPSFADYQVKPFRPAELIQRIRGGIEFIPF